jgi:hypothetical protein
MGFFDSWGPPKTGKKCRVGVVCPLESLGIRKLWEFGSRNV